MQLQYYTCVQLHNIHRATGLSIQKVVWNVQFPENSFPYIPPKHFPFSLWRNYCRRWKQTDHTHTHRIIRERIWLKQTHPNLKICQGFVKTNFCKKCEYLNMQGPHKKFKDNYLYAVNLSRWNNLILAKFPFFYPFENPVRKMGVSGFWVVEWVEEEGSDLRKGHYRGGEGVSARHQFFGPGYIRVT